METPTPPLRQVNYDEKIGKTVGRRVAPDPLKIQPGEIEDSRAWCKAFGGIRGRPGVYRFRTHEEADEWMMKNQTPRPRS